ncbi:hypothetical protein LINGRAHAP2_LOCUS9808 [Linum grandiflorum]
MVSPSTRLLRGFLLLLLIIVTTCLLLADVEANDVAVDGMVVKPSSRDEVIVGRKVLMVQPSRGKETVQKGKRNGGSRVVRRKSRRSLNSLHLKMNNKNSKVVDFTADYHLPKSHPPKHN